MRRFSQRSSLVTLSEINITPLLDLAFVLLIIFIITTPLLEKGIDLNLPKADGKTDPKLDKQDIKTVEINAQGTYFMNSRPMKLDQIVAQLIRDFKYNPDIVIYIRADGESRLKQAVALMDACSQNGISRYSVRTEPLRGR
jgi:biopolymer transport protein ExbD